MSTTPGSTALTADCSWPVVTPPPLFAPLLPLPLPRGPPGLKPLPEPGLAPEAALGELGEA
jgi:hypothetical protein